MTPQALKDKLEADKAGLADRLSASETSLADHQARLAALAADLDARSTAAEKAGGEAGALARELAEAKAAHANVIIHTCWPGK